MEKALKIIEASKSIILYIVLFFFLVLAWRIVSIAEKYISSAPKITRTPEKQEIIDIIDNQKTDFKNMTPKQKTDFLNKLLRKSK